MRNRDRHTFPGRVHHKLGRSVMVHRLLYKQHTMLSCETRQQMLRALKNEVPTQMRETNNSITVDKLRPWESGYVHIFEQINLLVSFYPMRNVCHASLEFCFL